MPFAIILFGIVAVVAGVRGTEKDLLNLVKGDFAGQGNFIYWLVAILAVGVLGYIPRVRPISDAFLVLIIVVLFLSKKGFFAQFNQSIASVTTNAPNHGTLANGVPGTNTTQPLGGLLGPLVQPQLMQ